jgi:hypothetical protein
MKCTEEKNKTLVFFVVFAISLTTILFSGCTNEKLYTENLDLIIPDIKDYGIPIQQLEYIYETNYVETEETNPIYDISIPEYIFIRYNGTGVKLSITFFALKLDSTSEAGEIFNLYAEDFLLHSIEIENQEIFGDETFTTQISLFGHNGHGLEFRYANVVIVMTGLNVDLDTLNRVATIIENDIESHLD